MLSPIKYNSYAPIQHPYGGSESEQDDRWFYDRVVGFQIPTEALRLVHPMARDLILKVRIPFIFDCSI